MYSELRAQSTRNTQQYDSTIQYKFQVLVDVLILVGNRYWSTVHIVHCLYSGVSYMSLRGYSRYGVLTVPTSY